MKLFSRQRLTGLLVTFSIFGLLWGIRLLFLGMVGNQWIGTLGITSLIMGVMITLSWRDKLGWYGKAFKRTLTGRLTKRMTKWAFSIGVFQLFIIMSFSAGIHTGETIFRDHMESQHDIMVQKNPEVFDRGGFEKKVNEEIRENPIQLILGIILAAVVIPFAIIGDFPTFAGIMANVNLVYGGQLSHLVDIILVEEIEVFCLLVCIRILQQRTQANNIKHNYN